MKLKEIEDPESYVYIKVLAGLANKFKPGDYVTRGSYDWNSEADRYEWSREEVYVDHFVPFSERPNYNRYGSHRDTENAIQASFNPIFKVIAVDAGYIT